MNQDNEKILLSVNIDASGTIKKIADLNARISDLRAQQKALDTSTEEGRLQFTAMSVEIKGLSKSMQEQTRIAQLQRQQTQSQEGSLEALQTQLSLLNNEYSKLSAAERKEASGKELQTKIKNTTDQLKLEEKALGNNRREVGNYGIAGQAMAKSQEEWTDKIKESVSGENSLLKSLVDFGAEGKTASGMFDILKGSAKGFGKALMELLANPIVAIIAAIAGAIMLVVKAFERNEEASDTVSAAWSKLSAIFDVVMKVLQPLVQLIANGLAVAIDGMVKGVQLAIEYYGKFEAKIISFVGKIVSYGGKFLKFIGLEGLGESFDKAGNAVQKFSDKVVEVTKKGADAIGKMADKEKELEELTDKIRETERSLGIEREKSLTRQEKLQQILRDTTKSTKERLKAAKDLNNEIGHQEALEKNLANLKLKQAQLTKEVKGDSEENNNALAEAQANLEKINTEISREKSSAQRRISSIYREQATQQAKSLESQKNNELAKLKLQIDAQNQSFIAKQKYDEEVFKKNQDYAEKELAIQLKYSMISKADYDAQMAKLSTDKKQFYKQQESDLSVHLDNIKKTALAFVGDGVDAQINDIERKYADMLETINKTEAKEPVRSEFPSQSEYDLAVKRHSQYKLDVATITYERDQEVQAVQQKALDDKYKVEEAKFVKSLDYRDTASNNASQKSYEQDYLNFIKNEQAKNAEHIKLLEEKLKEEQAAGLDTAKTQAELDAAKKQQDILSNAELLADSSKTEHERYMLTKERIANELKDETMSVTRKKQLMDEDAKNTRDHYDAMSKEIQQYGQMAEEALSSISEIMDNSENQQLQNDEVANEEKKQNLKDRLDEGLISQQEYNDETNRLDKDLDAKKAEVAKKQAQRDKAMKVFEIIINTASAIASALPNVILAAIAGAMGAAQLAVVMSTPLPKASRGMLLRGPSHSSGGIPIEAEGGEAIINKRSTAMFAPLLSAINQAGGGVPFTRPLSDGGYSARSISVTPTLTKRDIIDAVKSINVVATIDDIHRGDSNYASFQYGSY